MFGFGDGGVSFDPVKDIPDLSGKVILVTGGNSGLGAESIKQYAQHNPAEIWLAGRSRPKAEAVVKEVHDTAPDANIVLLELELDSLVSVKNAANTFTSSAKQLDILLLNAGVNNAAPGATKEGYEVHFGINHVGHALLTQLLLPSLLRSTDPRVVVVASDGHTFASDLDLPAASLPTRPEDPVMHVYGRSKLANILFARALAARYPALVVAAVHPGAVDTAIVRGFQRAYPTFAGLIGWAMWFFARTVRDGAKTQLWASVAEEVQSGAYYEPVGRLAAGSAAANDERLREELWEWTTEELARHGALGWP